MTNLAAKQGFTCVTCRLVFPNSGLQKEHYASEWHRYNAKRQVAGLPPVSENQFERKVRDFQKASEEQKKKSHVEKSYCKDCKKKFQSKNAFDNHLNSKRHKVNSEIVVDDEQTTVEVVKESSVEVAKVDVKQVDRFVNGDNESDSSEGWDTANSENESEYDESKAIPENGCLFCAQASTSLDKNLSHMSELHGFFVPDSEYCSDISGLVKYLGLKIGAGLYCIRCPVKRFADLQSCQHHMRDKSHFTFNLDGDNLMEYLDFYDYAELLTEDDSDGDNVAVDMGYTLVLPSGAKLGHRSLAKYFKQRLRSTEEQQRLVAGRLAMKSVLNQKALGWTGVSGHGAVQRARDFKFVKKVLQKQWLSKGLHQNKLFQSRGRDDQM